MIPIQQRVFERKPSMTRGQSGKHITRPLDEANNGVSAPDWAKLGQPWRRESEIAVDRQQELRGYLDSRRFAPFRGVKLTRADVEWLLAPPPDWIGPIN